MCRGCGTCEGNRVLLTRVTRIHTGKAWLSLRCPLEVWADVKGRNALALLLGEDWFRPGQGCRVWGQSLEDVCRAHTSLLSLLKETLGS